MLTIYGIRDGRLEKQTDTSLVGREPCWIDLRAPTVEEEVFVEKALALDIPPRATLQQLETSRRLRQQGGITYLTATIVVKVDSLHPETTTITWIIGGDSLVTVRYGNSRSLSRFAEAARTSGPPCTSAVDVFVAMLESIVARQADLTEALQAEIEELSATLFNEPAGQASSRDYGATLRKVGRAGEIASRAREAIVSLEKLIMYFKSAVPHAIAGPDTTARLGIVDHDLKALLAHIDYLAGKVKMLLEAALGLISIQQNNVIKMLSIVTMMFLPPTLIASVFGMNFKFMSFLEWSWGFDATLVAMIVAAIAPIVFVRWRGWI